MPFISGAFAATFKVAKSHTRATFYSGHSTRAARIRPTQHICNRIIDFDWGPLKKALFRSQKSGWWCIFSAGL
jgi:hypothetical protein